jgi:MFS family permease
LSLLGERVSLPSTSEPGGAALTDAAAADVPAADPAVAPGPPSKRAKWGKYGRRPLLVLSLVAFIDALDRGILPGALTEVQDDFGFGDTAAGFLGTAFVLTGFLVTVPSGYLADRYRRTRIIAVVMASWGVISALNAAVRSYGQFLGVRAALGVGETIDNPASQSLLADYYPVATRGRAYAYHRILPFVGAALGTVLGGVVAATLGWRWAFLLVGVPGSLLAVLVWRLPEPARGESDGVVATGDEAGREHGVGAMLRDVRVATSVPTLRSLMIGSAIASGALSGLGFWAPSFFERHTSLGTGGGAGLAGVVILFGALTGTVVVGQVTDRIRDRYEGTPMLVAGVCQGCGAALLMVTFLGIPLFVMLPLQLVAVALIVGGLVAIPVMITEVVPAAVRGITFSITGFFTAVVSALSPLMIGFVADRFPRDFDGEVKGDLAKAFLIMTPLVLVGAVVLLRGRRHVAADVAAAASALATAGGTAPGGA